MTSHSVNRSLLPGNTCFGCGEENPDGLQIEIFKDENNSKGLKCVFNPSAHLCGFPGITHGGAIYTAMDCVAAWVPTALKPHIKAIWILRNANITYHKAAWEKEPLFITGAIIEEGKDWEPVVVHTEAKNGKGELLTEAHFKVIPLPAPKFKKVAGIEKLPENWARLLGET